MDKLKLSVFAQRIFKDLYLLPNETIIDAFHRVANAMGNTDEERKMAFDYLKSNIWRTSTPIFINAGTDHFMGSACFPAGAPVLCDGAKSVPIEKLNVGDLVLTDNNRYKPIVEVMKREYNGKLIKIKSPSILNEIVVTEEHPFLVLDKQSIICKRNKILTCLCEKTHSICFKKKNNYMEDCTPPEQKFIWKKAKDIVEGDYLVTSYDNNITNTEKISIDEHVPDLFIKRSMNMIKSNDIIVDKDLLRLFGYYISEGDDNCGCGLRFSFSLYKENEKEYCKEIQDIILNKFGIMCKIKEWPKSGTRVVVAHSVVLSKLFTSILGKGFGNKILPNWIMTLNTELQKQLLIGIYRGDGYTFKGLVGLSLSNYQLMIQIRNILLRCGIFYNLNKKYISEEKTPWNYSDAYTISGKISVNSSFVNEIWNNIDVVENKNKYRFSKKIGDKFVDRVSKITVQDFVGDVYNLEVEDDHTYTINNICVHNCWITDLQDSMDSIYEVANISRKIFQHGAGIGIPIGNLREKDCDIYEGKTDVPPNGKSSGPVSFMHLYDAVGATTKSGGRARRAAIMCVMPINHPDIEEFIKCKEIDGTLSNMNISVSITDDFMKAFKDNIPYNLVSPKTKEVVKQVNARKIWDDIVDMAHKTADPGILFIDTINKYNVMKSLIKISATNPCGEIAGLPYLACNLSHVNLLSFCKGDGSFDMDGLYRTSYNVTKLMDNILDKIIFPDDKFKDVVLKYRPIGLGFMGLSDALYDLGIPYDSKEGQAFAAKCMKTITTASIEASSDLALEKGSFHNYDKVKNDVLEIVASLVDNDPIIMEKIKTQGLRNITHTTLAPTGSTAISADTSYGMEPCFGLVYTKTLVDSGDVYTVVNQIFQKKYEKETWYTSDLIEKIVQNNGSLKGLRGVPKEVRDVFVVAHDIKPKDRIDMQSALQAFVSNSISSCVCPDTLIETKEGLFYIDELCDFDCIEDGKFKENYDINKNVLDCNMNYSEISQFYNNGIAPVFKLTLKNGLEIRCTGNEKFILLDDETNTERWSELSFLSEGDRIKIKQPLC